MHTLTTAAHAAHLDPMTGVGIIVRPDPADDMSLFGPGSLHAADGNHYYVSSTGSAGS